MYLVLAPHDRLDGERVIATSKKLGNARKAAAGIAGRRIVRMDPMGEAITLVGANGAGSFRPRCVIVETYLDECDRIEESA